MNRLLSTLLALALVPACATPSGGQDSQLERLIGTWDGTTTTTLEDGASIEVRATTVAEWARPGEVLLERTVSEVDGETFTSVAVWVWDPLARACRTYRLRADGTREDGLARHDGTGAVWELQARAEDPRTGRVSSGEGSLRFETDDRRTYDWVGSVDGVVATRIAGSSERR